jgi:tRNA(fMet)-specific endonuclease VapC
MDAGTGYLLDTNIVLALMRSNPLGRFIDGTYGLRANLNRSLISVVSAGEMFSLARQFGWSVPKVESLKRLLGELVVLDINAPEILDAYGELDNESRRIGRTMGANDVWIAATARVSRASLLTTDKDFDHLDGTWIKRIWIDPQTGKTPSEPTPSR